MSRWPLIIAAPPILQLRPMRRAAGDADAARDRGVRADPAVVRDLDLVVELDVVLDHRVVDARRGRSSCWRRSRRRHRSTTPPTCGILIQRPASSAMPKPSAPIDRAAVQDAARADPAAVVDADARDGAACRRRSRRRRRPRSPAPIRARSPITAPAAIHGARPDRCRRSDLGARLDHGGRMDARRCDGWRMQDLRDARVERVGVGCDAAAGAWSPRRAAGARITAVARVAGELAAVLRVREERDRRRRRGSQRRHALDAHAAVAFDARAGQRGQLDERAARCGGGGWRHGDRRADGAAAATCRPAP